MTDIHDPNLISIETQVDTEGAEEGFSSFLEKMTMQSNETAKILKDLGGQLESLVDVVITKSQQARDTANQASNSVANQQKTIQEKLAELKSETAVSLDHIEKLYSEYGIKATGSIEQAAAAYEKAIRSIKEEAANPLGKLKGEEAKALLMEFESDLRSIRARIEDQKKKGISDILRDKAPDMSATGDIGGTVGKLTDSITSNIPSLVLKGGMLGMLLYGIGSADEARAQAATTMQWFRKEVGDGSREIADVIGGSVYDMGARVTVLSQKLKVSEADLTGVYSSMAKLGISAKDAGFDIESMDKSIEGMALTASGLQNNLGVLAIAVDKAFGLATGTALADAAKASREMGISVKDALEQMTHLRIAAEASGIGIDRYLGSVMQASKGLGQFGIDLGAATSLMQAFTDSDKEMGGNGARAGRAMQGVGQLFGNLQNNVGMTAFLGEKVFGGDPLEARRQMMLAFGDESKGQSAEGRRTLGTVIEEVQKVGKSAGGTEAQQGLAIEKVFGVDFQTAEMIRSLKPDQIKSIKEGGAGGLSEEEFSKVARGFESSKEKENSFKDFVKSLMNAIRDLLMGLMVGVGGILAYMTGNKDQATSAFNTSWTLGSGAIKTLSDSGGRLMQNVGGIITDNGQPTNPAMKQTAQDMARQQAASQRGYEDYGRRHAPGQATSPGTVVQPGQPGFEIQNGAYMEHNPSTGELVGTITVKMSPQALTSQRRAQAMSRGNRG